jgi:porin
VARMILIALGVWLTVVSLSLSQPLAAYAAPDSSGQDGTSGDAMTSSSDSGRLGPGASREAALGISSNPGAVNIVTGTGWLGQLLGLGKDSGVHFGGLWVGDANVPMSGGLEPGDWSFNSLTLLDLSLDAEKLLGLKGGMFGAEFLHFSGQPTNQDAGVVQGYNSLPGLPPLDREELYQLWWRQELFDGKLVLRIGKSVPTYDFNNVIRPVPLQEESFSIPAVTGLIYTPIFVNPTILGKLPGYYNSATGITTTLAPTKNLYLSYGFYDGNLAHGEQPGLHGLQFKFNGYYFHIGETGYAWRLGPQQKPGIFAFGLWHQTGKLVAVDGDVKNGAEGFYLFGSQRLWSRHPGQDNSGVSGFYQFGANTSKTMLVRQYFGAGLTGFGLMPGRPRDSMGFGLAWSWLNRDHRAGEFFFPGVSPDTTRLRTNEVMLAFYYQMELLSGAYFQPTLTYVPNPGQRPDIPDAVALTMRLIILF